MQSLAKSITIEGKQARYYDLSDWHKNANANKNTEANAKPPAHFYGGNSFTVGTYTPLLNELAAKFAISALAMQGYWYDKPTHKVMTREQDAEVLIKFLEKTQNAPIIGIGHSQGATATAMAAAMRPDLFSHLYLIEPVTFTKTQQLIYNRLPKRILLTQEPFKSTLTKPSTWSSVQDFYEHLRRKRAYRRISDKHLQVFAEQSLSEQADGSYALMFTPEQELANYFGTPFIDDALKKLTAIDLPYTLITGKPTLFISDKVRKNWQKFVPAKRILSLADYGHLLPMEAPKKCADIIVDLQSSFNQRLTT